MRKRETRLRRWAASAGALLAVLSLLVATLCAGHRYFACAPMGQSSFFACCHPDAQGVEPSIDGDACCRVRQFAAPCPGVSPTRGGIVASPLVAHLAVPVPMAVGAPAELTPDFRWARAGPYVAPRDHRIRLRVSLT